MSNRVRYDVTYDKNNAQWKGTRTDGNRASTVGETKQEVIKETVRLAQNHPKSQVVIHKQNGLIQDERTYGQDPYPPKG